MRGIALRKKNNKKGKQEVPDYKCILLGFLFLSSQTKAFLLPSLIDLPTLLMWVDGSACSESFASFSSVTFSLFQLPFLYNYTGCSSEQECRGADSPSNNRAGCCAISILILLGHWAKRTFNSTGGIVGGYSASSTLQRVQCPAFHWAELCVIALPVPGRVLKQRCRDHLPSFLLRDCICGSRRQPS